MRRGVAVLAVTGLVTAGLVGGLGAAAWALTGSTFESTDGNLVLDGTTPGKTHDWANAQAFQKALDVAAPLPDNSFGQGSKDDLLNVTVGTGSVPPNKSDLTRFYLSQEYSGSKQFLYLAWERSNTLGTANFSFELNQLVQPDLTVAGSYTLNRRAGDALITYDFAKGGNAPSIGASRWVTTGNPKTACQANASVPCWGKITVLSQVGYADGSINTTTVSDPIAPDAPRQLAEQQFGELAINLTDAKLLNGCLGFRSAYVKGRSSSAFDSELKDFIAPLAVNILQPPDATGAHADAQDPQALPVKEGAVAIRIKDGAATPVDLPAAVTTSTQTGAGSNKQAASQADVKDPIAGGDIVSAKLLSESADSEVDGATGQADQTTFAEVAGLNVLKGTLTADVVDAVALASASRDMATTNSTPTVFGGLTVDADGGSGPASPKSVSVTPGLTIPLNSTFFGSGSYITFLEETAAGTSPPLGSPAGSTGTYDASLRVTAIHVHVTDRDVLTLGNQTTDVVVSKAYAHASYTGLICTAPQRVSGNASILQAASPLIGPAPVTVGYVAIPATGGHDSAGVLTVRQPADPSLPAVVSTGVADTDTTGAFDKDKATSSSYAQVADVCISQTGVDANGNPVCTVMAKVVRSQANATAAAGSRSANGDGSQIVGLTVAGTPIGTSAPAPNTALALPGGGLLILNEQLCDGGGALSAGCAVGPSAGITVRTLHVILSGVLDVIVGESHADATFVAA